MKKNRKIMSRLIKRQKLCHCRCLCEIRYSSPTPLRSSKPFHSSLVVSKSINGDPLLVWVNIFSFLPKSRTRYHHSIGRSAYEPHNEL